MDARPRDNAKPVITDRTKVKLDSERSNKKMNHWLGVVASACEQSGRAQLPEIIEPCPLSHWPLQDRNFNKFALDLNGVFGFSDLASTKPIVVSLAIGSEGGFSEHDLTVVSLNVVSICLFI